MFDYVKLMDPTVYIRPDQNLDLFLEAQSEMFRNIEKATDAYTTQVNQFIDAWKDISEKTTRDSIEMMKVASESVRNTVNQ